MIRFSLFVLLASLSWFPVNGQTREDKLGYYNVESFKDYSGCNYGFINGFGDTIQQAIYSYVEEKGKGWLVFQGEAQGVLDRYGKEIVPCKYGYIDFESDFPGMIEARVNYRGPMGIYDWEGNVLVSDNHKHISSYSYYYRAVTDSGKVSILRSDFSVLIPPVYDDVSVPQFYNDSTDESQLLFAARQGDKMGIINQKMEVVKPFEYTLIYPFYYVNNGDTSIYFVTRQNLDNSSIGLMNFDGDNLLPEATGYIGSLPYLYDVSNSLWTDSILYLQFGGSRQLYNLNTGKTTPRNYSEIKWAGDAFIYNYRYYSLFRIHNVYGVLNRDFSTTHQTKKCILSYEGNNFEGDEIRYLLGRYYGQSMPLFNNDHFPDSLQFIYKIDPGKAKYEDGYPVKVKQTPRFGLLNAKTGKSLKMYDAIWSGRMNNESYVWAVEMDSNLYNHDYVARMNHAKLNLTIYDEEFHKIKKHRLRLTNQYDWGFRYQASDSMVTFFSNRSGKIGAINAKGEAVVPFEYDSYRAFAVRNRDYDYHQEKYYTIHKGDKCGVFDINGKEILPIIHDTLELLNNIYFMGLRNGESVIYDTNFREIFSGFDRAFLWNLYTKDLQLTNERTLFFVKDQHMYMRNYDKVIPVNEDHFNFRIPIATLFRNYVVRKDGLLLSDASVHFQWKKNECFLIDVTQEKYVVLDTAGNITLEIDGVNYVDNRLYNTHYRIFFKDGTTGILNRKDGTWIIPPGIYADIIRMGGKEEYFNVKKDSTDEHWSIIDLHQNKVFDHHLDYPLINQFSQNFIARNNYKYGLVNDQLEMLLPIEYDWIEFYGKRVYLLKDDRWTLYSLDSGVMNQWFDEIAMTDLLSDLFVFKEDSVAIVNFKGEYVVPYQTHEDFIRNHSIQDFIQIPEMHSNQFREWGIVFNTEMDVYQRISTQNALDYLKAKTTRNQQFRFQSWNHRDYNTPLKAGDSIINKIHRKHSCYVKFAGQNYYSVVRSSDSSIFSRENQRVLTDYKNHYSRLNYRVQGDTIVPIVLEDVFKPTERLHYQLDALLIQQINREQALGKNCPDIYTIISEMKEEFLISNEGIWFHHPRLDNHAILLTKDVLEENIGFGLPLE